MVRQKYNFALIKMSLQYGMCAQSSLRASVTQLDENSFCVLRGRQAISAKVFANLLWNMIC